MRSLRKTARWAVRWGLPGFVSGVLSGLASESRLLYHDQKTLDHMVWPGLVFALVVLLPLLRWAGDGWRRTAAALIASSGVYPIAWWIAASGIEHPGVFLVGAFACSGFLGSGVLAGAVLFGRRRWVKAASGTVARGTLVGGLMGAHLLAAMKGMHLPLSAADSLGVFLVLWQMVVGASLARGVLPEPD
ncbi:MAG: hypothetical protein FIB01_05145 [Gemmatimonadetes bacterium]|nr:hypothetical protein [Gemmatimonadota bacterium]